MVEILVVIKKKFGGIHLYFKYNYEKDNSHGRYKRSTSHYILRRLVLKETGS